MAEIKEKQRLDTHATDNLFRDEATAAIQKFRHHPRKSSSYSARNEGMALDFG